MGRLPRETPSLQALGTGAPVAGAAEQHENYLLLVRHGGGPTRVPCRPPAPSPPPGIGVRESFNQNAQTTLLVEGIFDSISTGALWGITVPGGV